MKSKNQLLAEFVKGYVHVSKKDYSFFSNLSKIITDESRITSNQAKLFDKLIVKYQRQLKKQGCQIETLLALDWLNDVVESRIEFTQTKIFCNANQLYIKGPFNTQFVQNFRRAVLNPFIWDNKNKHYVADYSTYNLKLAIDYVGKYYQDYVLCDTLQQIVSRIDSFQSKYWNPTLIKVQNQFYVVCTNEILQERISHIQLNDDPATLYELSNYGVIIDESITQDDELLAFAGSYKVTFDLKDLDNLVDMLSLLKVENVFTARDLVYTRDISNEIKTKLLEKGITCKTTKSEHDEGVLLLTNTVHTPAMRKATKIVQIKNSRPIHIK
jgi:hypothetical protein